MGERFYLLVTLLFYAFVFCIELLYILLTYLSYYANV